MRLIRTGLRGGLFEAVVEADGAGAPDIEVMHGAGAMADVSVAPQSDPGLWAIAVPVPPAILSDGLQILVVRDRAAGRELGRFVIAAGPVPDDDLRAEVQLLRAELDLLKRAVRNRLAGG